MWLVKGNARLSTKLNVSSVAAWVGDGEVRATDAEVNQARKLIQCARPSSNLGVVLATEPQTEEEEKRLPYGIFLEDHDLEELYMVLRKGNIVSLKK